MTAVSIDAISLKHRFPVLLDKFSHDELEVLLDMLACIKVDADAELQQFGDEVDALFLVWEGKVAVSLAVGGQAVDLGTMGSGESLGEINAIDPGLAMSKLTATEPSTVLCLRHTNLEALRRTHPPLHGKFLRALSLRIAGILRTYENYRVERTWPMDTAEFISLFRKLMGMTEI